MGIPGLDPPMPESLEFQRAWFERTSAAVGPLNAVYPDHVAFYDEFLPHVAMIEFWAWADKEFIRDPDSADLAVFLECLEEGALSGNGDLENVIAVSFVEMFWDSWFIFRFGPAVTAIAKEMYPDIFETGRPRVPRR